MKKLLLSTAILGAATLPAWAQDESIFREAPDAMEIRASDFMGMRVYATETAVEGEEIEGVQEGWEDIGEVNDVIVDREGQVQAVLVDIGGFLGIGERQVALSMDALRFVSDSATAEEANDFFLVVSASREQLEQAPAYEMGDADMNAEQAAAETEQAIEEGGEDVAAAAGEVAEGAENAVEETGEEIADAGAEVTDEAADAGEEVSEEVAQTDMTDAQEDQAEVADAQADVTEEATEETAQAEAEVVDESADQAEATAEATQTEQEMATDETAAAATGDENVTVTTTEGENAQTADAEAVAAEETEAVEGEDAQTAEAEATTEVENTELTSAETRTPIAREGFTTLAMEEMTAERLQGAAVYDANDERVGEVGEIVLSAEGQVQDLVIDVGGFLGIGEKPVALPLDTIDILQAEGGDEIRVYVSQTEEELEQMERYEAQ